MLIDVFDLLEGKLTGIISYIFKFASLTGSNS